MRGRKQIYLSKLALTSSLFALLACGGGGGGGGGGDGTSTGYFIDAPVEGVSYETSSGIK